MSSIPGESGFGLYLPTTTGIDPQVIRETAVDSPQFKDLLVRLYQQYTDLVNAINLKDSGYYIEEEFVCGRVYFPAQSSGPSTNLQFRNVYRKVINFGSLPNAAPKNIPHGITIDAVSQPNLTFTHIYGVANDLVAPEYIPLPYASPTLGSNIELSVDAMDVIVTTGSDRTNFTVTRIVLEFLKN